MTLTRRSNTLPSNLSRWVPAVMMCVWWPQKTRSWRVCKELSSSITTVGDVTKSKCSVIVCSISRTNLKFLYFAFYYLTSMRKTWRDCLGEISIQSPIAGYCDIFVLSQEFLTLSLFRTFCPTWDQRRTYAWALSPRTWWPVSEVRASSSGRQLSTSFRSISASAVMSRQWSG